MLATTLLPLMLAAVSPAAGQDFTMRPSGAWRGIRFQEAREFSTTGVVSRLEMSLYNRGDDKTEVGMSKAELRTLLDKVVAELNPQGKPPPVEKRKVRSGGLEFSQRWPKLVPSAELVWGVTGETVDFVRLTLDTAPAKPKTGAAPVAGNVAKAKVKANVVKEPSGDVRIDNVPMVDQGQKGYCAVAASERVLRYYGVDVDEHEIAQAAGTSAEGGTSTRGMKDSVQAIGRKYKLATVVTYGDFEKPAGERIAGLVKEVANYNKAAKKLKKKEIAEDVYIRREGNTIYYSYRDADAAMDPEVLRDMKVNGAQRSKFTRFMKDVRDQVNKGIPLFWGVTLGTYPEPESPQSRGGHIRLIIGYNDRKKEILYTDTWGAGHELKRMPAEWAWTISHCLLYMKPLR